MEVWKCPGNDTRALPQEIFNRENYGLADVDLMVKLLETEYAENKELRLPFVKNMEAAVLGAGIKQKKNALFAGDYCCNSVDELENLEFDFFRYKYMTAVLEAIERANNLPLVLEMDAPFSVAGAVINPSKLFKMSMKEPERLKDILDRIADAEEKYIVAAVKAGARVISFTDAVGEADIVGQKFYKEFSGKVLSDLLKRLSNCLSGVVIHICGRTTCSMKNTGLINLDIEESDTIPYQEKVFSLTNKSKVTILGNMCIHQNVSVNKIYVLELIDG